MNNYYLLSWKHKGELTSAFALGETKLDHELIPQLRGKKSLPFDFELKRVKEGKEGLVIDNDLGSSKDSWLDYQPNSLAWPMMSQRLKFVVENNLTGNENIDWLDCKVKSNDEEKLYYILRFNEKLDVLDTTKTMFVPGTDHIIRPVFAISKIKAFNIFHKPSSHDLWRITPGLYVSEMLKKAIQKEKLKGIEFEKTRVT